MPETEVHRLKTTKQDLASLGATERRLVFLLGHMANELQTLNRLLVFSVQNREPHEVAERIAGGRANVVLRLLCGKLWEAHELVSKRVESCQIGRKYADLMDAEGKECHKRIRRLKGEAAGSLLAALRNNHAFHYPENDQIDKAFENLPDDEELEFFVSPNADATYYHAAEIVFQAATMNVTGINDVEQAINHIIDIVCQSTRDLITFSAIYIATVLNDQSTLMHDLPCAEIIPAEYLEQTHIPPITVRHAPAKT